MQSIKQISPQIFHFLNQWILYVDSNPWPLKCRQQMLGKRIAVLLSCLFSPRVNHKVFSKQDNEMPPGQELIFAMRKVTLSEDMWGGPPCGSVYPWSFFKGKLLLLVVSSPHQDHAASSGLMYSICWVLSNLSYRRWVIKVPLLL